MASRKTLWIPFDTGSNNSVAATQGGVNIDAAYSASAAANFKGTVIAVKGFLTFNQDAPSNSLERFAFGIGIFQEDVSTTVPDLWTDVSKEWFWQTAGYVGGPGGDSTALANVMAPFTVAIDARSKRVVGYQDVIRFNWKTTGVFKLGAAGRILLLES